MNTTTNSWLNKVPEVTLAFWIIKIMSTTVGETGADFLAFNIHWGLGVTTVVMSGLLLVTLVMQLRTTRYTPWLYWLTVVLVSIVGTQITDLLTDKLGVSLYASTLGFSLLLGATFLLWYRAERSLSIHHIITRRRELFYWAAILCTFALGTAAGDLISEEIGIGFLLGTALFGGLIVLIYSLWRGGANPVLAFWLAYILTRPLGASLGDLLTQAHTEGGLGFDTMQVSALFLAVIIALVTVMQLTNNSTSGESAVDEYQ